MSPAAPRWLSVACPTCAAPASVPCEYGGVPSVPHDTRVPHAERIMSALSPYAAPLAIDPPILGATREQVAAVLERYGKRDRALVDLKAVLFDCERAPRAYAALMRIRLAEYQAAFEIAEDFELETRVATTYTRRAPTVTGESPPACVAKGHGCLTNPCFGCPNA